MYFTLLRVCSLLAYLLLASGRPQVQTPAQAGPFSIGALDDWASSGNYLIYSCASQVAAVQSILDITYLALQTAILSTDSPAYKAFFRSADPDSMTVVLNAITAGTNITTTLYGSRRPTMVCVNAIDTYIRTFWSLCQDSEDTMVIQPPGTSIVFLCPRFFDIAPLPVPTDCAVVNHASTALIPHVYIAGTQYGFLVHTLADIYLREMKRGRVALGGNVRDENACLALPPDQALKNPSSYAFYTSSELKLCRLLKSCTGRC